MLTTTNNPMNLGPLQFGQPYNFKYTLFNEGEEVVTVTQIIVGCGSCTTASMNQSNIPPNGKADLFVIFTPGSTGIQSKGITVQYKTANGEGESLPLTFRASV